MTLRRKQVTMKDVADLAGVSKQTVSAVINSKSGIPLETQDRIRTIISKVGYRPHSVARSLATGRTYTAALIVSDVSSPFIGALSAAAEDYAHAHDYSLVLFNTHDDLERERAYFIEAIQRGVDGILFISATDYDLASEICQPTGIPTVAIDRIPMDYSGPSVVLNNFEAGRLAALHLTEMGHQHLAHISGPLDVLMSRQRMEGFRDALEKAGIPDFHLEKASGWDYASGCQAMQRILQSDHLSSGVFAAGDVLAIGAMRAIHDAGLKIPGDISIIGVDDIDSAVYLEPPLTTLRQSIADLAILGLQLLFDILDGRAIPQPQVIMTPKLAIRQSTGKVRETIKKPQP